MKRKCAVYLKKFRVMTVKTTQSLRNKMEAQSERMEAWMEKTQEMLDKDLEDAMSKATTGTKSALEGADSKITEAKEW